MITFREFFLTEAAKKDEKFIEFAKDRRAGCEKVISLARAKGGAARLTVYHFEVKLPYYKQAAEGKFNVAEAKREYRSVHSRLASLTVQARPFQELVGRLEVLGELILAHEKGVRTF